MEESQSNLMEKKIKDINTLPSIEIKRHKGEDNILYNIKIFQGEKSIIFQIQRIFDFSELIYEGEYTLEELYNKNNFFRCYSSIKDIFKEFFIEFKEKAIIISKNDDKINLKFKFKNLGKIQIIEFVINNKILNHTKIILKLCNKIVELEKLNLELNNNLNIINNELKKQIEYNKNETKEKIKEQIEQIKKETDKNIKDQISINKKEMDKKIKDQIVINKKETDEIIKEKIIKRIFFVISIIIIIFVIINFKFTKDKINDIEYKIKDIENNKLNSIEYKIKKIENIKINSIADKINNKKFPFNFQLYNSFFDIDIYISLMNKGIEEYFNKNIRKYELLYQASIDGFGKDNFHKKCDGKKNTIVLVFTDKNRIFGGFTELEWDNYSGYKEGNKGFIFSINDNKKMVFKLLRSLIIMDMTIQLIQINLIQKEK